MTKSQYDRTRQGPPPAKTGVLILASTSIGLHCDIPAASIVALQRGSLLVFEEHRQARYFLKCAGIHREYILWNEHRDSQTLVDVREALRKSLTVVYMCDQGTANLCDPGAQLCRCAYELNARVQVIPGPSALTAAIAASPFPATPLRFLGFLERDGAKRNQQLLVLATVREALGIMDTPYRLSQVLESCLAAFGEQREGLLALDICGPDEHYLANSLPKLVQFASNLPKKLNFVLLLSKPR